MALIYIFIIGWYCVDSIFITNINTFYNIFNQFWWINLFIYSLFWTIFVFFYFNTQMHERYAHSALLFFFLYGVKSSSYWLYGLTSLAYFLNMESVLNAIPFLHPQTFIFDQRLIAVIYLIVIIIGIWKLYEPRSLPPPLLQENM